GLGLRMNPLQQIVRLHAGIASRCRNLWFRALGVRFDGYVWMRNVSIPRNCGNIHLAREIALDDGVVLLSNGPGKLHIGRGTYVNRYTIFDVSEMIEV